MKTRHAEMLLLREHHYRLPEKGILWTTLKPCRMCAAWIVGSIKDAKNATDFRVVYFENDPGRFARNTALDELKGIQYSWEEFKRETPEQAALFSEIENARAQSES